MSGRTRIAVSTPIRLAVGLTIIALSGYLALDGLQDLLRLLMARSAPPGRAAGPAVLILVAGCCLFIGFRVVRPTHSTGDSALLSPRGWRAAGLIALALYILLCILLLSVGVPWWSAVWKLVALVVFAGWCFKAARGVTAPHAVEYYTGEPSNPAVALAVGRKGGFGFDEGSRFGRPR
jgi:hypothetical protein